MVLLADVLADERVEPRVATVHAFVSRVFELEPFLARKRECSLAHSGFGSPIRKTVGARILCVRIQNPYVESDEFLRNQESARAHFEKKRDITLKGSSREPVSRFTV